MNYNKQNYLPNTLNRNNAFKINVVTNSLYVCINVMYRYVNYTKLLAR